MTVYADEAFLLNGAVDYLLLVCAAKLGGGASCGCGWRWRRRSAGVRRGGAVPGAGVSAAAAGEAGEPCCHAAHRVQCRTRDAAHGRARSSRPSAPSAALRSQRRSCSAQACSCCRAERSTRAGWDCCFWRGFCTLLLHGLLPARCSTAVRSDAAAAPWRGGACRSGAARYRLHAPRPDDRRARARRRGGRCRRCCRRRASRRAALADPAALLLRLKTRDPRASLRAF